MKFPQTIRPIIMLFIMLCLLSEKQVYANNLQQGSIDGDLILQQTEEDQSENRVTVESPYSVSDPDLELGFPIQTLHQAGTYKGGTAINTRVGNIDADPQLEIMVSGLAQGPLYAWNYDGTPVSGWPVNFYKKAFYTSFGNLSFQSPGLEVFTGQFVYRTPETPPGPMLAYTGAGVLMSGWPIDSEYDISGSASLADVNGDGLDEIFVYEGRHQIYAYQADGNLLPGWPVSAENPSHTIADLDQDGDLEIVTFNNWTSNGADLIAYHHDGSRVANFSVRFDPYGLSSPVSGDVDGDGSPEIIVFSRINAEPYLVVFVISSTGTIKRQLSASMLIGNCRRGALNALALADMNADSIPEIVIGLTGGIIIWQGDGTPLPGYPVIWGSCYDYWSGNYAPVVGDVDGDQLPDIVIINQLSGSSTAGDVYVFDQYGNLNPHFPKRLPIGAGAVPAIADIDLDNRNEIIVTGAYWDGYSGNYDNVWAYDLGGTTHGRVEWGQLGGGHQNQGRYPVPPSYSGSNLYIFAPSTVGIQPSQLAKINLVYGNTGAAIASSVTLTMTLDEGLTYISDTSQITPTIIGESIVWNLPNIEYLVESQFEITVQLPDDAIYGDNYVLGFFLAAAQPDADSLENSAEVNIQVVRKIFLPYIDK